MPSRSASLVIAALWASGCFHPTYDHPACGTGGACPDGLTCNPQGICDSAGPGGGVELVSQQAGVARVYLGGPTPSQADWNAGSHRIDIAGFDGGDDGDNSFFGTSLAQLAPAGPAGTLRPAVTLARPAHGTPSSYWR